MSAIGENIRSIRREQKLTQLALAMRVGVTPQAVGKWERGESEPDISLLLPIAKALNVTAETLFGLENRRGSAPASFLAEEFPESLKCRRLAANLTQAELARKLDVRPQTVSKWENGVCAPDAGYLAALCSLYGISPSALLSERALPPQRAQAPAVPAAPAPAAAECVKKPGFFSKRPVRAAALALFLVLALCIVLVPFSLGSSSRKPRRTPSSGDHLLYADALQRRRPFPRRECRLARRTRAGGVDGHGRRRGRKG